MYSFKNKTIILQGRTEPIRFWEIWFRTPSGLHDKLDAALVECEKNGWDADLVIVPVSVVVGSTIYEEIGRGA